MKVKTLCVAGLLVLWVVSIPPMESHALENASSLNAYNITMLSYGISKYYSTNYSCPESISDLYDASLIPSNLVNTITGEIITANGSESLPGSYAILPNSADGVDLFCYGPESPIVLTHDSDILGPNTIGGPEDTARGSMLIGWARISVQAYESEYGQLPQSIYDMQIAGLWPYEGLDNFYTGLPMQFASREPGDMLWEFNGNTIFVRVWLEPDGDAVSRMMAIGFPLSAE